jgi:hypothetical protein
MVETFIYFCWTDSNSYRDCINSKIFGGYLSSASFVAANEAVLQIWQDDQNLPYTYS